MLKAAHLGSHLSNNDKDFNVSINVTVLDDSSEFEDDAESSGSKQDEEKENFTHFDGNKDEKVLQNVNASDTENLFDDRNKA